MEKLFDVDCYECCSRVVWRKYNQAFHCEARELKAIDYLQN
jgi:hypothetical protein